MRSASATTTIGERQNAPGMIALLRARARMYAQVKLVQRMYFSFILALPIVSLAIALKLQDAKPWVGLVALTIGAIDAMFIDSWRKRRIKTAARVREQFDCAVLDMAWNQFTAGRRVTAEEVSRYAHSQLDAAQEARLRDWYPANACDLPLHAARLVCQRTNLWYDAQLRGTYRTALWVLAVAYFLGLLAFAWQFTVAEFILVALIPFGPFFTWVVREHHRQRDTIALVERLLSEIDNSFGHADSRRFRATCTLWSLIPPPVVSVAELMESNAPAPTHKPLCTTWMDAVHRIVPNDKEARAGLPEHASARIRKGPACAGPSLVGSLTSCV